jgi:predicted nucleotidyltransferase
MRHSRTKKDVHLQSVATIERNQPVEELVCVDGGDIVCLAAGGLRPAGHHHPAACVPRPLHQLRSGLRCTLCSRLHAAANCGPIPSRQAMKSREDVLQVLRKALPALQEKFPISRIALFGSYAREEQRADSDVDILVEVDPSIGLRFSALAEELERLLEEPVELVSSRAISPSVRPLVEADCIEVA